jgi:ATP-dependent exoDNAse (exonuclease V) beta subunit
MTVDQIKKQWEDNRVAAANKGTMVHDWIENYYLKEFVCPSKEASESKSFQNFMEFHNDYGWKPYRTEWRVYTEEYKIAGSIDIVFEGSKPGWVKVYDWKNSKEIKTENKYEKGHVPLSHLPNCNFYHYSLQLNIYKWILEHHYNVKVEEMGLIVVHESFPTYLKYEVKDMSKDVQSMFEHYKASGLPKH